MSKPPITTADLAARVKRQEEWREFRKRALFSQRELAELLEVSTRTVQNIEGGRFTPIPSTLNRFRDLKRKHEKEAA